MTLTHFLFLCFGFHSTCHRSSGILFPLPVMRILHTAAVIVRTKMTSISNKKDLLNIMIYSIDDESFEKCRTKFCSIFEPDYYVVYRLNLSSSSSAWLGRTRLLILGSQTFPSNILKEFLASGGNCLSLHPVDQFSFTQKTEDELFQYYSSSEGGILVTPAANQEVLMMDSSKLVHICTNLFKLKCSINNQKIISEESTSAYLIAEPFHREAFQRINTSLNINKSPPQRFNQRDYFQALTTRSLGRTCLYYDTTDSTHNVLERNQFLLPDGAAVIARRQTLGKGRSGNVWMSPEGCLAVSIKFDFSLHSEIGRHLSLLQHVAALAVVLATKSLPGCQDLPLGIKWPNDVYQHSNGLPLSKICGILSTTSIMGSKAIAMIGIGVNLNNSKPTMCLNQLVKEHLSDDRQMRSVSLEHFVASILNQMEKLVDLMMKGHLKEVLELYHKHWLHAGALVKVQTDNTLFEARIVDVDEFGFLRVRKEGENNLITVHPDGNSFDMLNGLLLPKSK